VKFYNLCLLANKHKYAKVASLSTFCSVWLKP